jgi:RsiW-degrading membrane proteinase PrsW (M82 family)
MKIDTNDKRNTIRASLNDKQSTNKKIVLINNILIILIFILAWLPSLIWLWIYWLQDREQPEPKSLIRRLFLAGVLITLPVLVLERIGIGIIPGTTYSFWKIIPNFGLVFNILTAILITALVEEYLKYFITKKIVWPLRAFDQIIDGVIYGVSVALGFALIENFLYFLPFVFQDQNFFPIYNINSLGFFQTKISSWELFFLIFISRFLLTTLMHTLCSGIIGLYLGKAHFDFKNSSRLIRTGIFLAISFHALFNLLAFINQIFFAFILTAILAIYFIPHLRNKENLRVRFKG